jgi:hypothetical protein
MRVNWGVCYVAYYVVVLAVLLALGLAQHVSAQDTTTMLSSFLNNLRQGHLTIGVGSTAPVLSSCGTGTLATGSTDSSGRVTATGATGCTVTFGASFGANSADCVVSDITATRANMTVTTNQTALVVASMTSGDTFTYLCAGR